MSGLVKVKIIDYLEKTEIYLNGKDITQYVHGYTIQRDVDHIPSITLEMLADEIEVTTLGDGKFVKTAPKFSVLMGENKSERRMQMESLEELKKLAEPLRDWLASNYDPMCQIVIETDRITVLVADRSLPLDYEDN